MMTLDNNTEYMTVVDIARRYGIAPRLISDLFYARKLRDDLCKIVAGRRLIPLDYVTEIERILRRDGKLNARREATASA